MPRYKYTQESGVDFKVVDPDKADGQEDTNQVRQVVDDLGNLLVHSKRDDLYPKDGTTGGNLAIPESQLNISNIVFCSDYDHPDDAITAISTDNKTLLVTEAETCDTNFTVPANVKVKFERGGKWTINTGITVTFNGQIEAGLWQIFEYVGTGTLAGNPLVDKVYPQWWINAGSGLVGSRWTSPSNTAGIQEALDFLSDNGGIVFLQSGYYQTSTTIHLSNKQCLQGVSDLGTVIVPTNFAATEDAIENMAAEGYVRIENIQIFPTAPNNLRDLIHFTSGGFNFRNIQLKSSPRHGIYLESCWYSKISDCHISYSGEIGIYLYACNGLLLDHVFVGTSGYLGVSSVTPYGIYDYVGRGNSYIGCSMEGSTGNTEGAGIKLQGVRSALITGCYIEANSLYGIYCAYQNVTSNGSNISIISNYITSSDTVYGIYLHSGTLINISNNHITGNKSIEILAAVTNVKLENNTAAEVNNASTSVLIITGKPKLSVFAATTSAELAGVISDETGTGKLVFEISPRIETPQIVATTTIIADDTAISLTPANLIGILYIYNRVLSGVDTTTEPIAMINYDLTGTVGIASFYKTANVELATGILAGTTGTDAKFTVSVHTDGKIYMENRLGATKYIGYSTFFN